MKLGALELLVATFFILYGVVLFFIMFVHVPTQLYTEAECLEKGYPKFHVTYKLERYCSTLDGVVTVKVERQK